jgi:hypothetical protein
MRKGAHHVCRRACVQHLNLSLYRRYDEDIAAALGAIEGTAKHSWLSQWRGQEAIAAHRPLVYSYFARIPGRSRDGTACTHVLACNGFIWNGDPEIDFTLPVESAAAYAQLVRRGTATAAFIKRPMPSGPSPYALPSRNEQGALGISRTDEALQTPVAIEQSPSPVVPATSAPFPGADLLEMPLALLSVLSTAWDAGDWGAADAALHAAAVAWAKEKDWVHLVGGGHNPSAVSATAVAATRRSSISSSHHHTHHHNGRYHAYDGDVDVDSVPNLRPDVLPVPLAAASTPYMRRDIVIWGDCVKLRYGLKKQCVGIVVLLTRLVIISPPSPTNTRLLFCRRCDVQ